MPASKALSHRAGPDKNQKSISSFFSSSEPIAKPPIPPTPRRSPLVPVRSENRAESESEEEESLFVREDDNTPTDLDQNSRPPKRAFNDEHAKGSSSLRNQKRQRISDVSESSIDTTVGDSIDLPTSSSHHPTESRGSRKPKTSERTSKYLFSSSPVRAVEDPNDEETLRYRDQMHRKFVKKLGRPDSIAEIKRRNWQITEKTAEDQIGADEDEEPEEDEAPPEPPTKGKKGVAKKKASTKLTPMELQMLEIKRANLDTLLVIEVGYKYRFFGEDARTAAKELSIVCIPGKFRYDEHPSEAHLNRFASASIPVHRLHVHVKRLVAAGHKVGVVRQIETAALKAAGDNRNTPFIRKLTNLYTKGTYIDDAEGLDGSGGSSRPDTPATGYLLCLTENRNKDYGTDEKVHVGILAVQPATGDVIYDDFEDGFMRSEIETRLLHLAPCEFLIVGELSKATEKMVQHLSGSKTNVFGDKVRVERVDRSKTMAALSYSHVSNFYAAKMKALSSEADEKASLLLDKVMKLSESATICLSAMITHMTEYGLEHVFDLTKYFQSFSARSHMLLNGTTLTSLEIYQNQTDHSGKGSLFWALNRTQTRFGQRLLRNWVGRPLLDRARLEERVAAVEELKEGQQTVRVEKIGQLLSKIKSDLEKSLIRIYYGKCTRPELLTVLQTLQLIAGQFSDVKSSQDVGFASYILNEAVAALPTIAEDVVTYLERINLQAAKEDDKYNFFREGEETDLIAGHKLGIVSVEHDLDAHRALAAEKAKKKKVEYVTVAGIEYLIEIDNTQLKSIPASWMKISGTKKVSRFHTPEVVRLIKERDQHKEALAAACNAAFAELLAEISSKYQTFRDCIQALATLDCLVSLSIIAGQPNYVKPEYTDEIGINVEQGRHPMVEQILLDGYVPNDIELASDGTRALLITGPNMGGKSSYVRQVALIAIMGQIGSYVPADSARLGMLDAVFTRMGAFDNIMAGESTFMVELSETSDILKQASPRSLIILDELGRGTSTHDGVAIAQAVLDYIVREKKSLTLFITHFQQLATMAKTFENGELRNVHMKFTETGDEEGDITFLYEIGEGVAHRSYGLNVARLANIPKSVLDVAVVKSKNLEDEVRKKQLAQLARSLHNLAENPDLTQLENLVTGVEQL